MNTPRHHDHLSAESMQAFLDGELPAGDVDAVRAHVDGCARCRAEMEAWETLFDGLGELPALSPSPAFRGRILEAVPSEARISAHVAPGRLQDHLEGRLAARVATEVDAHLDHCAVCRSELAAFRAVSLRLDGLTRLAPAPEFGERVMAAFRVEQMVQVAMAPTTRWGRVAAWARAHVPSSRQGWAAALGAATAPAVIAALLVQAVFSSPLVTVGNLLAFVRLKTGDALVRGGAWLSSALDAAGLGDAVRLALEALQTPTVAAAAATVASGLTFAALWVVYRFLVASQPASRSYAHVSR